MGRTSDLDRRRVSRGTAAVLEFAAAPARTLRIPPGAPSGGAARLAKTEQGHVHHQDEKKPRPIISRKSSTAGVDLQPPGRVARQIERRTLQNGHGHLLPEVDTHQHGRDLGDGEEPRVPTRALAPGCLRSSRVWPESGQRAREARTRRMPATRCTPRRASASGPATAPADGRVPGFPRPRSMPRACSRGPAPPPVPPRRVPRVDRRQGEPRQGGAGQPQREPEQDPAPLRPKSSKEAGESSQTSSRRRRRRRALARRTGGPRRTTRGRGRRWRSG